MVNGNLLGSVGSDINSGSGVRREVLAGVMDEDVNLLPEREFHLQNSFAENAARQMEGEAAAVEVIFSFCASTDDKS